MRARVVVRACVRACACAHVCTRVSTYTRVRVQAELFLNTVVSCLQLPSQNTPARLELVLKAVHLRSVKGGFFTACSSLASQLVHLPLSSPQLKRHGIV